MYCDLMPEPLEIIVDKATATVEYPLGEGDYLISFMQGEEDMIVTATEDELKNAGIIPDNQEVCYITVRRGPDGKEICEYAPMPMDEQDFAHKIAQGFPRLERYCRLYQKIFIYQKFMKRIVKH